MSSVLVIDDSDSARARIRCVLEDAGLFARVVEARDGIAGLQALLTEAVDAVLCDLEMPGLDGEKLLRAHRERAGAEDVPFFFLTAERDPDRLARLLRGGAADTVTKPFHPAELIARLETHLRLRKLRAELREKNAILERLSTTDDLTGLRNRRFVGEVLAFEVMRATRYGTPLSVLMADVDHFKRVNDQHGHPTGDAVLAFVGRVVAQVLRTTDVAGRYGGEEFLVVLPNTDLDGAAALGERLRGTLEASECEVPGGARLAVSISAGVAQLAPGEKPSALVQRADAALYEAKGAGRNRIERSLHARRGVDTQQGKTRPGLRSGRSR